MNNLEKFLEFNGKRLAVLNADGQWWIAIKPICEALEIKYESQFERIQNHKILGQLFRKQGMVAADGRLREMACLPEKYVYGWLFSINSDSLELIEYQQKCYDILFDHFHGAMTGRLTQLNQRSEIDVRISDLEQKMLDSPEYTEIQQLKKQKVVVTASLRQLDKDLMAGQLALNL